MHSFLFMNSRQENEIGRPVEETGDVLSGHYNPNALKVY